MSFEVPKKVAVILVHQGAAKLPALKVFVASKLENQLHRMLFVSVKNVRGLAVLQPPWCTRMTSTFLGTSKLILNGVRGPRSLLHVECPPDSLEKCWFTY